MIQTTLLASLLVGFQAGPARLHVDGPDLKTPSGEVVRLRGCNLGNWLVIEHWMWDQPQPANSSQDQYDLENILSRRFGDSEKDRLMNLYRSSWITDRDFKIIKSFRFNCVRLPMNYRLFEDDSRPFHLRPDAFRWSDRAVELAKRNGIYVVLDMHGVQGGQNPYDHTGRRDQNKLWSDPENQNRMAWLWGEIAKRYRNEPTVVAYDVFNEPYGGEKPEIAAVWRKSYDAIRRNDPDKLVWAAGRYDGFEMYGVPAEHGLRNVGIEMHYYPGLFGNGDPGMATSVKFLHWISDTLAPQVKRLNVPFYVGEMNVVFKSAGGAAMMRRTFDLYESLGWNVTMWSYKLLHREGGPIDDGWAMVTNRDPMPPIDFATAPESAIESFFASGATMPYSIFTGLRDEMAPEHVDLGPLPAIEQTGRQSAPQGELTGWQTADVGGAKKGGLSVGSNGSFDLFGGGADIWGANDQFRYLYRTAPGDLDITVRVRSEEELGPYCKAGPMLRGGLATDAPFVMLSVFPDGGVQLTSRKLAGIDAEGSTAVHMGFPLWMRLVRKGGAISGYVRKSPDEPWTQVGETAAVDMGTSPLAGVVALSHDDGQLIKVSYSDLMLSLK